MTSGQVSIRWRFCRTATGSAVCVTRRMWSGVASAEEVSSVLAARLREWTAGAEQHDDLTFVVAAMSGSSPS